MEKEDATLLIQLLNTMKDLVSKLEEYEKKGNFEKLNKAKKELLDLQGRIDSLVR